MLNNYASKNDAADLALVLLNQTNDMISRADLVRQWTDHADDLMHNFRGAHHLTKGKGTMASKVLRQCLRNLEQIYAVKRVEGYVVILDRSILRSLVAEVDQT